MDLCLPHHHTHPQWILKSICMPAQYDQSVWSLSEEYLHASLSEDLPDCLDAEADLS